MTHNYSKVNVFPIYLKKNRKKRLTIQNLALYLWEKSENPKISLFLTSSNSI